MKKLIATFIMITASAIVFANTSSSEQNKAQESTQSLTIYSNQGRVEIKDKSMCRQIINSDNSISIQCNTQCTQGIDKSDGKALVQC
ncbi:hypothetical protein [Limnohabitans sp.]|uniref:hypothetical protein n=1 Tax=Limnohabitans sp. TaxID=1907725 RepID=UPI0035B3440B